MFKIVSDNKDKTITFLKAVSEQEIKEIVDTNFDAILNKKLLIQLGSSNALTPKPIKRTIKQIIEDSS